MQYFDTSFLSATIVEAGCQLVAIIFSLLLLIAVITLLISAFYFLISGGREEQKAKAKGFFIYSLVGVALAVLAPSIVAIAASFFGVQNQVNC